MGRTLFSALALFFGTGESNLSLGHRNILGGEIFDYFCQ